MSTKPQIISKDTNSQIKETLKDIISCNIYNQQKFNKVPIAVNIVGVHGIFSK